MSNIEKNYMDEDNITDYDTRIKNYIGNADASAYKTILFSANGKNVNYYKKENATLADIPDFTTRTATATVRGTTLVL